jgi:CheY-like chemotaxis protein
VEARDGTEALETLRSRHESLDVVLLDITLPGASSREVLLEANKLSERIKVVVTSAYSREFASETLQTDPEYFIRKPYRALELAELLGDALGRTSEPAQRTT